MIILKFYFILHFQNSGDAVIWTTRLIRSYTHVLYYPRSRLSEGMVDHTSPCVPSLFVCPLLSALLVKVITHKETAAGWHHYVVSA